MTIWVRAIDENANWERDVGEGCEDAIKGRTEMESGSVTVRCKDHSWGVDELGR